MSDEMINQNINTMRTLIKREKLIFETLRDEFDDITLEQCLLIDIKARLANIGNWLNKFILDSQELHEKQRKIIDSVEKDIDDYNESESWKWDE